jgi:biopolymer transport protein ExbD
MARGKIKRKSTSIDMTAMCDVAFLLLSFFILTAKFKPSEAVDITTPSSVASKSADLNTNAFVVSIDKLGKVYIELSDEGIRGRVMEDMEALKGATVPADVKDKFKKSDLIGVPFASLPEELQLTPEALKKTTLPGIPIDSTGGELKDWIAAALAAYGNNTNDIHFIIKGDNDSKYPVINNVLSAFKKNEVYKYKLLTTPEGIPPGTELYKKTVVQGLKQDD